MNPRVVLSHGIVFAVITLVGCSKTTPPPGEQGNKPSEPAKIDKPSQPDTTTPPKQTTPKAASAYTLTAQEYYDEWNKDGDSAKKKFEDAVIEVSGVVDSFYKDGIGAKLNLEGRNMQPIECYTKDKEPWAKAVPGQKVKLKGVLTIAKNAYTLEKCEIVEVGPSPAVTLTAEDLATEYVKDPEATIKKYNGKYLVLSGEAVGMEKGARTSLLLKNSKGIKVLCTFEEENPSVPPVGQRTKVVGRFADFTNTEGPKQVEVDRCGLLTVPQK